MALMGKWNWWAPRWLKRRTPASDWASVLGAESIEREARAQ